MQVLYLNPHLLTYYNIKSRAFLLWQPENIEKLQTTQNKGVGSVREAYSLELEAVVMLFS